MRRDLTCEFDSTGIRVGVGGVGGASRVLTQQFDRSAVVGPMSAGDLTQAFDTRHPRDPGPQGTWDLTCAFDTRAAARGARARKKRVRWIFANCVTWLI